MSPWGRPGPGVQGLPVLFIATAESNLCPTDTSQSLDRDHFGSPSARPPHLTTLGRIEGKRPGSRAGGRGLTPGPRIPRFYSLGGNSVNYHCHQEGWGFPASS